MRQRGTDDSGSSVLGERVGVSGSKSRIVLLWMVASAGKESPLLSHGPTHVAAPRPGSRRCRATESRPVHLDEEPGPDRWEEASCCGPEVGQQAPQEGLLLR